MGASIGTKCPKIKITTYKREDIGISNAQPQTWPQPRAAVAKYGVFGQALNRVLSVAPRRSKQLDIGFCQQCKIVFRI